MSTFVVHGRCVFCEEIIIIIIIIIICTGLTGFTYWPAYLSHYSN